MTPEVLSGVSIVCSILVAVITALARTAEAEKGRRLDALEKQDAACIKRQEEHAERLRLDELATERLAGRMALVEQKNALHAEQLGRTVSQVEFERAVDGLQKAMDTGFGQIAQRLDRFDRSGSRSGGYQAVRPEESKR